MRVQPAEAQLDAVLQAISERLSGAISDSAAPFRYPMLATVTPAGAPSVRTVVLRAFAPGRRCLACHTDRRAAKVVEIAACDRVSLSFCDMDAGLQLRADGNATIHVQDACAEAAWRALTLASRKTYLADPAPGSPIGCAGSGLPGDLDGRLPSPEEAAAGYANFAVIAVHYERFDWVSLAPTGNCRAVFNFKRDGTCEAAWRVP